MLCLAGFPFFFFGFILGAGVWVFAVHDTLVTQMTAFAFDAFYILHNHCRHPHLPLTRGVDTSYYSMLLLLTENAAHCFD